MERVIVVDLDEVGARQRASDEGTAAVLAHVDRTTADLAAATLLAYGIEACAITDPAYGNAKSPTAPTAPAHGVVVKRGELALARDVLRRSTDALPREFGDAAIERWSATRRARRGRGAAHMVAIGAGVAALFVLAVVLAEILVAILT